MSRRLALVAMVVTAVGLAGPECVQAPSAGETALETVALEDLQVLAPGARFTAVQEMVLSGLSLGPGRRPAIRHPGRLGGQRGQGPWGRGAIPFAPPNTTY